MTTSRYPFLKPALRKVLSQDWQTATVITAAVETWAHTSVKHALRDMAVDGEVEFKVDHAFIKGRQQLTNHYRFKTGG